VESMEITNITIELWLVRFKRTNAAYLVTMSQGNQLPKTRSSEPLKWSAKTVQPLPVNK